MLTLPVLTHLRVDNYGLFPGADDSGVLEWGFDSGLTLIVGVNGLGKTTLMNMLLRSLTGPYDISSAGIPVTMDAILPAYPTQLSRAEKNFFSKRVADDAEFAEVCLTITFEDTEVEITRSLSTLALERFCVGDEEYELPTRRDEREELYQEEMCGLFDLSSFVDVLLVLHHIVFLTDKRTGALWDENAQRQILRAIFLEKCSCIAYRRDGAGLPKIS